MHPPTDLSLSLSLSQMQINWAAYARVSCGMCEKTTYHKLWGQRVKVDVGGRMQSTDGEEDGTEDGTEDGSRWELQYQRPQWLKGRGGFAEDSNDGGIDDVYDNSPVAETVEFVQRHLRMYLSSGKDPTYTARNRKTGAAVGTKGSEARSIKTEAQLCELVQCHTPLLWLHDSCVTRR